MKKKFLSLFTVIVALLLALALLACEDYNKDDEESTEETKTTYTHTITNGTFYNSSTTATKNSGDQSVLDSVSNWARTTASLTADKGGSGGVFVSAVDLANTESFEVLASKYLEVSMDEEGQDRKGFTMKNPGVDKHTPMVDDLDKDGKKQYDENDNVKQKLEDTNALVVASVTTEGSVYAASSTATLAANSRYLLQFSVASMIDAEEGDKTKGAWFVVSGDNLEYTVKCINTNGEWKTYYLFIETNKNNSMSISVQLWLGYGPNTSTSSTYANDGKDIYATRGVAIFDNVLCEKVDDDKLATVISSEENVATYGAYEYDENAAMVDNFASFKASIVSTKDPLDQKYVMAKSAYYLSNTEMELRAKPSSYTTGRYREYFYTFRENYSSENIKKYSLTSSSTTDKKWYGSVDASKLYDVAADGTSAEDKAKIKDKYSTLATDIESFKAMGYDNWYNNVMNSDDHKLSAMDEQYVMMIYNNELKANKITTGENIVIEPNKYYEISVWAYVWAEKYTRDEKDGKTYYYSEYTGTTKPTDPLDSANKTVTDDQKKIYKNMTDLVIPNVDKEDSVFKGYTDTFTAPTDTEVTAAKNAIKDYTATTSEGYKTYVAKAAEWIRDILGKGAEEDINGMDSMFYYCYLYNLVNGEIKDADETTVVTAPEALSTETNKKYVKTLYLNERKANVDAYKTVKEKVDEYDKNLADWEEKESEYNNKWTAWENANENGPKATVSLTGVESVKDKKEQTSKLNEWQKLTFYVKGNQLSERNLKLEMAMGTGTDNTTYMIGGAFFDSISIKEYADKPEGIDDNKIISLADIDQAASNTDFGGLAKDKDELDDNDKNDILRNWDATAADGTASGDKDAVTLIVTNDAPVKQITVKGTTDTTKHLYALNYSNNKPTASSLTYAGNDFVEILPNKFYRFAFLVKTNEDMDADLGITIKLVTGKDKNDLSVLNTSKNITKYTTDGEWKEVVYYICGDLVDTYYAAIAIDMGSGTRFATDSYVEGTVSLAAFNCLKIDQSEYSDASTGDKIVSGVSLYNISTELDDASTKFDNPYYSKITYSDTDEDQFDESGKLTGMGKTTDWSTNTIANSFSNAPKDVALSTGDTPKLTWGAVEKVIEKDDGTFATEKASSYEIWMKYTDKDNKTVEKLYDVVEKGTADATPTTYTFTNSDWTDKVATRFAVKAIASDAVSSLSSYTSEYLGSDGKTHYPETKEGAVKTEAKAGTILASSLEAFGETPVGVDNYVSPYKTVMKLTSNYYGVLSVTSDTLSGGLGASGYYKISVWVKTDEGTKASVTLTSTSGALQATTDDSQLGFVQIDTKGEWQEYCIYIKTGNFSAKMAMKYSIGNPYAKTKTQTVGSGDKKSMYMLADMSKGNAYFDAVKVTSIEEDEYNAAVELDREKGDVKYASAEHEVVYTGTPYYIYTMQYTMDSFDVSTESSSTSTNDNKVGNTPSNYSRGYDNNLSSTSGEAAIYGVFNYDGKDSDEKMATAIKNLYSHEDDDDSSARVYPFKDAFKQAFGDELKINGKTVGSEENGWTEEDWDAFIKEFLHITSEDGYDGGSNVLAMSNKLASGYAQHYSVSSSYNYTAKKGTYTKLTFTARTLIAAITGEAENSGVKQYTYSADNAFGEFRVTPSSSSDDTVRVKISSKKYGNGLYDDVTYTVYLKNDTSSDNTVNWAFYLGDEKSDKADEWYAQYLVGLMAIDLVSVESTTKEEYESAVETAKGDNAKVYTYEYTETTDDDTDDDDEDDDTDEDEESFWDKLVKNEYFWLYISSFVIAIVIIAAVIAVLVSRWKKKHPKEVVVENVAKTEKDVKVIPPAPQIKEEALEMDEYVDEPQKIDYVQRVNKNKSRKNRKNGKK